MKNADEIALEAARKINEEAHFLENRSKMIARIQVIVKQAIRDAVEELLR